MIHLNKRKLTILLLVLFFLLLFGVFAIIANIISNQNVNPGKTNAQSTQCKVIYGSGSTNGCWKIVGVTSDTLCQNELEANTYNGQPDPYHAVYYQCSLNQGTETSPMCGEGTGLISGPKGIGTIVLGQDYCASSYLGTSSDAIKCAQVDFTFQPANATSAGGAAICEIANPPSTAVNGSCLDTNVIGTCGQNVDTACKTGTPVSPVDVTKPLTSVLIPADGVTWSQSWKCAGSNGGTTSDKCYASCVAPTPVNGSCGSSNTTTNGACGSQLTSLCNSGTANPSAVSLPNSTGNVNWICNGQNGGTSANCSASCTAGDQVKTWSMKVNLNCPAGKVLNVQNGNYKVYYDFWPSTSTNAALGMSFDSVNIVNGSTEFNFSSGTYALGNGYMFVGVPGLTDNNTSLAADKYAIFNSNGSSSVFTLHNSSGVVPNTFLKFPYSTAVGSQYVANFTGSSLMCVDGPVAGVCGSSNTTTNGTCGSQLTSLCNAGTAVDSSGTAISNVTLPNMGGSVNWNCNGVNGSTTNVACSANCTPKYPDLIIKKTADKQSVNAGATVNYTIKVKNIGDGATTGAVITVEDTLPAGLSVSSVSGVGWNCTKTTNTISCDVNEVLSKDQYSTHDILVVAVVSSSASAGNYVNNAKVSGGGEPSNLNIDPSETGNDSNNNDNGDKWTLAVTLTEVNAVCGSANRTTNGVCGQVLTGSLCLSGNANQASVLLPSAGGSVNWTCNGANGGSNVSCSASCTKSVASATSSKLPNTSIEKQDNSLLIIGFIFMFGMLIIVISKNYGIKKSITFEDKLDNI